MSRKNIDCIIWGECEAPVFKEDTLVDTVPPPFGARLIVPVCDPAAWAAGEPRDVRIRREEYRRESMVSHPMARAGVIWYEYVRSGAL